MLWLVVNLTTVIPCLGVFLLLIFVSCNVPKIVLIALLSSPPSTHTSPLLERLYIGCLLNIFLYLRLPYWCISSYKVLIQNILYLFLNHDSVIVIHVKAKLIVCCLRSYTLPLKHISLPNMLASYFLMILQRFRMIYLMMYTMEFCFSCAICLEYVFRWSLSTIKILLEILIDPL